MKRLKYIFTYISIYIGIFVLFTVVFFGLFNSSVFRFQHVFFYRGLLLLLLTCLVTSLDVFLILWWLKYRYFESMISALMLAASIHLSFFVVFPVTFERSISMYLLNTLQNNKTTSCGGLTREQMNEDFINTYVVLNAALQKRITEQSIINMIEEKNNCYAVTSQAVNLLKFFKVIRILYNIKQ